MRAAEGKAHELGGKHISGGERLVREDELSIVMNELLKKSLEHSRGKPDFIRFTIDKVKSDRMTYLHPLCENAIIVSNYRQGRQKAKELLAKIGVSKRAIENTFPIIEQNNHLRGAMIIDSKSGKRLDHRGNKGVRVSRMDWKAELTCSDRYREAMALATKVVHSPYTLAELCWSDDPDYIAGYVASQQTGYTRISPLKENGCESGGRIFFVKKNIDLEQYIDYLERKPVLIQERGG